MATIATSDFLLLTKPHSRNKGQSFLKDSVLGLLVTLRTKKGLFGWLLGTWELSAGRGTKIEAATEFLHLFLTSGDVSSWGNYAVCRLRNCPSSRSQESGISSVKDYVLFNYEIWSIS